MASNNSSTVQSFSIALIVFVMLTFVLAVTTYLFFKKADENLKISEAKQKEASDFNSKRLEAEKNRLELVKDVLGFEDDVANPEILKTKQDEIDDVYGQYLWLKDKDGKWVKDNDGNLVKRETYRNAVKWLSESIETHHASMLRELKQKKDLADANEGLVKTQTEELKNLRDSRDKAQADLEALRKQKIAYETESGNQKKKLEDERDAANSQAKRLKLLGEEIAKAQPYLSVDRRRNWPGDAAGAEPGKGAADESPDERRVALMLDEMRERERTIIRLNKVIAQLRVADPALQNTVLAATPKDDRVDGFDGRILSVNELDRTVLVACGRTTGLRAGLQFNVYDPTDPQPQIGSKKAVVEVVSIESDSLVRCRVRRDSTRNPIVPGDVVATSLWSPGTPLEVVIVGVVNLGGDPEADRNRLGRLVERIGGTVGDDVTPSTTMIVDAGLAQAKGLDAEGQGSRKQLTAKQKENRSRQLEAAKQLGIKVMAIEPFLGLMGLQMDSVRADRLPVPIDEQAAPTPAANAAY